MVPKLCICIEIYGVLYCDASSWLKLRTSWSVRSNSISTNRVYSEGVLASKKTEISQLHASKRGPCQSDLAWGFVQVCIFDEKQCRDVCETNFGVFKTIRVLSLASTKRFKSKSLRFDKKCVTLKTNGLLSLAFPNRFKHNGLCFDITQPLRCNILRHSLEII